jgi:hypothetical protein
MLAMPSDHEPERPAERPMPSAPPAMAPRSSSTPRSEALEVELATLEALLPPATGVGQSTQNQPPAPPTDAAESEGA